MKILKTVVKLVDRYWEMLARERVHVFYSSMGRDPWCLSAIPTRRSEELGLAEVEPTRGDAKPAPAAQSLAQREAASRQSTAA